MSGPGRVLVTGASGFIGGRLCEVMALTGGFVPRAMLRSTGSAARIARMPLDFAVADLLDREAVDRAVAGCDAVVHLARGSDAVMHTGLDHLLRAAVRHRVSRFVHVSSVAVYGNNPPPESVSEDAPTRWTGLEYGDQKLAQEYRVLKYRRRHGLATVILRPPNVYGPFAPFTTNVVSMIRGGRLPIVDGGGTPCNLVGIDNLIEALLLAIWKPEAVGETFFVTDPEPMTWERCLEDYARLLHVTVPRVSSSELAAPAAERAVVDSVRALPRVLLSGELRSVLQRIPLFRLANQRAYDFFESLPESTKSRVRLLVNGPTSLQPERGPEFQAANGLIAGQRRKVRHSSAKAARLLGYSAPVSYRQGMALTEQWLRQGGLLPPVTERQLTAI